MHSVHAQCKNPLNRSKFNPPDKEKQMIAANTIIRRPWSSEEKCLFYPLLLQGDASRVPSNTNSDRAVDVSDQI